MNKKLIEIIHPKSSEGLIAKIDEDQFNLGEVVSVNFSSWEDSFTCSFRYLSDIDYAKNKKEMTRFAIKTGSKIIFESQKEYYGVLLAVNRIQYNILTL